MRYDCHSPILYHRREAGSESAAQLGKTLISSLSARRSTAGYSCAATRHLQLGPWCAHPSLTFPVSSLRRAGRGAAEDFFFSAEH